MISSRPEKIYSPKRLNDEGSADFCTPSKLTRTDVVNSTTITALYGDDNRPFEAQARKPPQTVPAGSNCERAFTHYGSSKNVLPRQLGPAFSRAAEGPEEVLFESTLDGTSTTKAFHPLSHKPDSALMTSSRPSLPKQALPRGTWRRMMDLFSQQINVGVQFVKSGSRKQQPPSTASCILRQVFVTHARHGHDSACRSLEIKWAVFLQLLHPFRFALEAIDVMDYISVSTMNKLSNTPEHRLEVLDNALEQDALAASNSHKACGYPGQCSKSTQQPQSLLSSAIKRLIRAQALRWDLIMNRWEWQPQTQGLLHDNNLHVRCTKLVLNWASTPPEKEDKSLVLPVQHCHIRCQLQLEELLRKDKITTLQRHAEICWGDRVLEVHYREPRDDCPVPPLEQTQYLQGLFKHGIVVCARLYKPMLCKPHDDTSSATFYMFAVKSLSHPPEFQEVTAEHARDCLGGSGVRCLTDKNKVAARFELLASRTVCVDLPEGTNVLYCEDVAARDPMGQLVMDEDGKQVIMTDGAGLMSMDLVSNIPAVSGGALLSSATACEGVDPEPTIVQVRVMDERAPHPILIKGTLTPCAFLPPKTLLIPFSMVKAPSVTPFLMTWLDPIKVPTLTHQCYNLRSATPGIYGHGLTTLHHTCTSSDADTNKALKGIQSSSNCNKAATSSSRQCTDSVHMSHVAKLSVVKSTFSWRRARGSIDLVLLLDRQREKNMILRRLLTRWMQEAEQEVHKVVTNYESAVRAATSAGRQDVLKILLSGCHETRGDGSFRPCAYLMQQLHSIQQSEARGLREMRFELPDSFMMVGVPDASGSIPAGCVVAMGGEGKVVVEATSVLLYRAPGLEPNDIVRATAVTPSETFLNFYSRAPHPACPSSRRLHPAPAMYFSTLGLKSLASCMATGDFDGDEFYIMANKELVSAYKPCPESDFTRTAQSTRSDLFLRNLSAPGCRSSTDIERDGSTLCDSSQRDKMCDPRPHTSLEGLSKKEDVRGDLGGRCISMPGNSSSVPGGAVPLSYISAPSSSGGPATHGWMLQGQPRNQSAVKQATKLASGVPLPEDVNPFSSCEMESVGNFLNHGHWAHKTVCVNPVLTGEEATQLVLSSFLKLRRTSWEMKKAATLWRNFADLNGVQDQSSIDLARLYSLALDAPKSGATPHIPHDLTIAVNSACNEQHKPIWTVTEESQLHKRRLRYSSQAFRVSLVEHLFWLVGMPAEPDWSCEDLLFLDPHLSEGPSLQEALIHPDRSADRAACERELCQYLQQWEDGPMKEWSEVWSAALSKSQLPSRATRSQRRQQASDKEQVAQSVLEKARAFLLAGCDPSLVCFDTRKPVFKAIALYRAVYTRARRFQNMASTTRNQAPAVGMVWQVAGDYLCWIKAIRSGKGNMLPHVARRDLLIAFKPVVCRQLVPDDANHRSAH
ncbi:hypothetical protein CEUSTIGMA_g12760.t1 [Chlamydomonas eustigma]|uniref:RNA-dependent RNA polymerase n=1 Tax=Chlamydomonas eustigma TaxID=1157962 RepID=A0A250XQP0_9CHLO|nr:hypothetical protein CEUSTIGMA_g12760.t1 [Chlamydomonas eustigma]|eukprot:GAX85343.1 hypothetical protein CEUSTIGMA_g12760.t1 [Chlamydomonas eustigma]